MRPFRSRAMAAIVLAVLMLGMLGSVADAARIPDRPNGFPEDPWPSLGHGHGKSFPEDPWPDAN